MQRFGNVQVCSVFGIFHPKIVISISVVKKKKNFFFENGKLKPRFLFLVSVWNWKPGVCAYYVVVWLRHTT